MEIERKFLMKGFPEGLPLVRSAAVEQGYLSVAPAVRIRRTADECGERFELTVKSTGTLVREEIELPLTGEQYTRLCALLPRPPVRKDYRVYAMDGYLLECSLVDSGTPDAFYYAEVEFDSEQAARAFVPPALLGRDVTEEPGFTMADYWVRHL